MVIIDTSALVRYFTNDDMAKADLVEKLIEKEKDIFIPDVVFSEIDFVLNSVYSSTKENIIDAFLYIFGNPVFKYSGYIVDAFRVFRSGNLGMYDCIIAAQSFEYKLASFDKKLLKVEGVNVYWK